MKLKDAYFYTIREDVKEEESVSGNLLVKSGMIRKTSAGIYMYLPMGYKVLKNIENIIRKHMNMSGATEVLMPSLVYEDYYASSGRKAAFGASVFALKDRFNKPYILGPTHEELFALAASYKIRSYKDLPFNLYQFQTKFRDEARPRFGLIRVREFCMKDAYSFDKDLAGLDISYMKMFNAYKDAFDEMKIDYKIVTADTGVMGGLLSEEFQAVTDIGEDTLVLCPSCGFASNLEVTPYINDDEVLEEELLEAEEVHTPDCKTIEAVAAKLNIELKRLIKALMFNVDGKLVIAFIPGDREVNESKLLKLLGGNEVALATEFDIKSNSNTVPGYCGPINLEVKEDVKIVIDKEILKLKNFATGANKKDYHFINANIDNFKYDFEGDISLVKEKDSCPDCFNKLIFKKGIEIGNTFKLGTKYADALDVKYLDHNNKLQPVVMGSYGIGPGRCMVSIVEQNNDENGIVWPYAIAPFKVAIVIIDINNEQQLDIANQIYDELNNLGIESVLDDRDERAGVKFNDMDLIGIPIRITVGRKAAENIVELKYRDQKETIEKNLDEVISIVKDIGLNLIEKE